MAVRPASNTSGAQNGQLTPWGSTGSTGATGGTTGGSAAKAQQL